MIITNGYDCKVKWTGFPMELQLHKRHQFKSKMQQQDHAAKNEKPCCRKEKHQQWGETHSWHGTKSSVEVCVGKFSRRNLISKSVIYSSTDMKLLTSSVNRCFRYSTIYHLQAIIILQWTQRAPGTPTLDSSEMSVMQTVYTGSTIRAELGLLKIYYL